MCAVLKTSRTILTIAHIWRIILSYYKQQEAYMSIRVLFRDGETGFLALYEATSVYFQETDTGLCFIINSPDMYPQLCKIQSFDVTDFERKLETALCNGYMDLRHWTFYPDRGEDE